MCLKSRVGTSEDQVTVEVPPSRHDVIHACDIYEDVAVAYGYNNIKKTVPKTATIGAQASAIQGLLLFPSFSLKMIFFYSVH
jgi:phenylalanyl-tRNA synthetase beta chain